VIAEGMSMDLLDWTILITMLIIDALTLGYLFTTGLATGDYIVWLADIMKVNTISTPIATTFIAIVLLAWRARKKA